MADLPTHAPSESPARGALYPLAAEADVVAALFSEITAVANELRKHAARLHREDHLPPGGLGVLELLLPGPRTVPQMARTRGTSRQNVQIIVNRLRAQTWVETTANPAHKRCPLIAITESGRAVVAAAASRVEGERDLWQNRFQEAQARSALENLRRLRTMLAGATRSPSHGRSPLALATNQNPSGPKLEKPLRPAALQQSEDEGLPVSLL